MRTRGKASCVRPQPSASRTTDSVALCTPSACFISTTYSFRKINLNSRRTKNSRSISFTTSTRTTDGYRERHNRNAVETLYPTHLGLSLYTDDELTVLSGEYRVRLRQLECFTESNTLDLATSGSLFLVGRPAANLASSLGEGSQNSSQVHTNSFLRSVGSCCGQSHCQDGEAAGGADHRPGRCSGCDPREPRQRSALSIPIALVACVLITGWIAGV